jgi:hypothetical protein
MKYVALVLAERISGLLHESGARKVERVAALRPASPFCSSAEAQAGGRRSLAGIEPVLPPRKGE